MNAKQKFETMYNWMPEEARQELVLDFSEHPKTIEVVALEVSMNTELGKDMLKQLGFEDD